MRLTPTLALLLAFLLADLSVKADVIFSESFNNSSLPAGWTATTIQGSQGWTFPNTPAFNSQSGGNYAVFDDYTLGAGVTPNQASITTPAINCTGRQSVRLRFNTFWYGVEFTHGYVEVSNNGGGSWNIVQDYELNTFGSLASPYLAVFDISAWAANQPDVRIRFRYSDGSQAGRYWYIDDVKVYSEPDVGITQLVTPVRLGCSAYYGSSENITVRIQNFGLDTVSNIPVRCTISGGINQILSGTYTGTINGQSYADYTFPATADLSADAVYHFLCYTQLAADQYYSNDTLLDGRHQTVTNYPYLEDFNVSNSGWLPGSANPANTARGFRHGVIPYLGGAQGNGKSWYLSVSDNANGEVWVESPVFNLSGMSNPMLNMDIKYQLTNYYNRVIVQYSINGGTTWVTLGTATDPLWYNSSSYTSWNDNYASPVSTWQHVQHSLCTLAGQTCVKFRIATSSLYYNNDRAYFAFDNFMVEDRPDVGVIAILAPVNTGCNLSANQVVTVRVYNWGCSAVSNIPLNCEISGAYNGTLTGTLAGPLNGGTWADYTFPATFDMTTIGTYYFEAFSSMPGDTYPLNDTLNSTQLVVQPTISAYPYLEDFNSSTAYWLKGSSSADTSRHFTWGSVPYLNGPQGQGNSWYLVVPNNGNGEVWVESPVFDFSNLTDPELEMDIKYKLTNYYNRVIVQYSTNGGGTWTTLGTAADPNWYNSTSYNSWNDNYATPVQDWTHVNHDLCALSGQPCVKFRISTSSLYYNLDRGWFAFDNFYISGTKGDDLEPLQVVLPHSGVCGLHSATEPVAVVLQNNTCRPLYNVPVQLIMSGPNNATLNETVPGPVPAFGRYLYNFSGTINLSSAGTYNLQCSIDYLTDTASVNDTIRENRFSNTPVTTYPYLADFNNSNQGWVSRTTNAPRLFIRDSIPYLGGSQGNGQGWFLDVTNNANGEVWVESPVFSLTGMTNPMLSMDVKYQLTNYYNRVIVQYSLNGGTSWTTLGSAADPMWYNSASYTSWNDNYASPVSQWTQVQHNLCNISGQTCVKFRIATSSLYYNYDRAWFAFDNFRIEDRPDVGVIAFLNPVNTGCNFSPNQAITVRVYNWGCAQVSNIPVFCEVSGQVTASFSGIVPGPINANSYADYTFASTFNMTAIGTYFFEAWTQMAGDINPGNDTLTTVIQVNQPTLAVFPYLEDFNANNGFWTLGGTSADTSRHFTWGSVPYLNGPQGQGNSWYLVVPNNGNGEVWVESPVFDFSNLTDPELEMDIKYKLTNYYNRVIVQYSTNGGGTWTTLGTAADPNWYNSTSYNSWNDNYATPVQDWTHVNHDLCALSGQPCVKFRISTSSLYYNLDRGWFAFDNFYISGTKGDDLEPLQVVLPHSGVCGLHSATEPVAVVLQNNTCRPLYNVPVQLIMSGPNNATLNETVPGPVPAFGRYLYNFSGTINLSSAGTYNLQCSIDYLTDTASVNDTIRENRFSNTPVTTYPYLADFNNSNQGWVSRTTNAPRLFIRDSIPYLGGSQGNGQGWFLDVTNNANGEVWVESPVFSLTGMTNPMLSMDVKYQLTNYYNRVIVQYSLNGGTSWTTLGSAADPMWYNSASYTSWNDNYASPVSQWTQVQHNLCNISGQTCVKFRIATSSLYYNYDRAWFAFDNFRIEDRPDVGVIAFLNPVNTGCNFSPNQAITVRVYNWGCAQVSNIPVFCEVSGQVTASFSGIVPGPINANSYADYTFASTFNMTAIGSYFFEAWTQMGGDPNIYNDSVSISQTVTQPTISSFPYIQNFNPDNGFWKTGGTSTDTSRHFTWGVLPYLNGPQGQGNSWYLMVPNNGNGEVWVESPVFDFTGLTNPKLSMYIKYKLTNYYNRVIVQYSTNGGTSWTTLGTPADPNWYNSTSYNSWNDNYASPVSDWTLVEHNLCNLAGLPCVRFRVSTSSLYYNGDRGWFAFDNFMISNTSIDAEALSVTGCYGSPYELEVSIRNRNYLCILPSNITSIDLTYTINGSIPVTQTFTGLNIAPGFAQTVIIPNVYVPDNASQVVVWCSMPNGLTDQYYENDTAYSNILLWPHCNDHCSNAIELNNAVNMATQTYNATADLAEDPDYSACSGTITVENTVWYYFTTDCNGGDVSVTFQNINCAPTPTGIQVSIDQLSGATPCDPASYTNVFCASPGDQNDIIWTGTGLPPVTQYYITIDGVSGNQCSFQILLDGAVDTIQAEAGPDQSICSGNPAILTGAGGGNYTWSSGDTTAIISVTPAVTTTYFLTVTNASCVDIDSVTVFVTSTPEPAIFPVGNYCISGNSDTLLADISGGVWSGGGISDSLLGIFDPALAGSGTHQVIYTLSGACTGADTVSLTVVPQSDAAITPVSPLCVSSSAFNLSAAEGGGIWTGNGITNAVNGTFDPLSAGAGSHTIVYTIGGLCGDSDTVNISVSADAQADIDSVPDLCVWGGVQNLTAAQPGGIWSGWGVSDSLAGIFDPAISGSGNFPIVYSIAGLCGDTDTVMVSVLPGHNADITPSGPYCSADGAVSLLAAEPGGYWSGTGVTDSLLGTFSPAIAGSGTHQVIYIIPGLCGDADTLDIIVNQQADAGILQPPDFCTSDAAVNLSSVQPGGTWSGIGITDSLGGLFDPAIAGAGTHWIVYSIPGACGDSDTVSISVNTQADATISNAGPFCTSDPAVNLTAADPGGSWSGSGITSSVNGTFDPAVAGAGTHSIFYSIGGTCGDADTLTITVFLQADASINAAGPFCSGDAQATLSAAGSGGTWTGTGITNGLTGLFDPAVAGPGNHVITYTIGGNCGDTDTVIITVIQQADASIQAAGPFCAVDSIITLTAAQTGGNWSGTGVINSNSGSFNPAVAGSGTHEIVYSINGSCGDSDTVSITVLALPIADAGNDTSLCAGDMVLLTATGGGSYLWSTGQNSAVIMVSPQGTTQYFVSVSNTCGIDIDSVSVQVHPLPDVDAGEDQTSPAGVAVQLGASGADSYIWSPSWLLTCSDCASPLASPEETTMFIVTGTNAYGCSSSDTVFIFIDDNDAIYIPNIFSPNGDQMNDILYVRGSFKWMELYIYDRWGEKVFESHDQADGWNGEFRGKSVDPGVFAYYLKIEKFDGSVVRKQGNITLVR
mgnify:FL=1